MLKKVFKILLNVYLVIILFPYIIMVVFYALMKHFAKDGSKLDSRLGNLENDLMKIMLDTVKKADIDFLLLNLIVFIWISILIIFFKKYKFVIGRKKKVEVETKDTEQYH